MSTGKTPKDLCAGVIDPVSVIEQNDTGCDSAKLSKTFEDERCDLVTMNRFVVFFVTQRLNCLTKFERRRWTELVAEFLESAGDRFEGSVGIQLAAPESHDVPALGPSRGNGFGHQTGLANSGLALDNGHGGDARSDALHRRPDMAELWVPTHQLDRTLD